MKMYFTINNYLKKYTDIAYPDIYVDSRFKLKRRLQTTGFEK